MASLGRSSSHEPQALCDSSELRTERGFGRAPSQLVASSRRTVPDMKRLKSFVVMMLTKPGSSVPTRREAEAPHPVRLEHMNTTRSIQQDEGHTGSRQAASKGVRLSSRYFKKRRTLLSSSDRLNCSQRSTPYRLCYTPKTTEEVSRPE
eukprot:scaffold398_cov206-Pinguiococcus_pyrenoidosus.AAC.7